MPYLQHNYNKFLQQCAPELNGHYIDVSPNGYHSHKIYEEELEKIKASLTFVSEQLKAAFRRPKKNRISRPCGTNCRLDCKSCQTLHVVELLQ